MATETSTLTSKYQATIPEPVRRALGLKAGDKVAFDIDNGTVRVRKAAPLDLVFAGAVQETLGEWHSSEDDEAYAEL